VKSSSKESNRPATDPFRWSGEFCVRKRHSLAARCLGTLGAREAFGRDTPMETSMIDDPKEATRNPARNPDAAEYSNTSKDPADWVTGDEPMTGAQASYLKTLCEEMGEDFDPSLTKAGASELIDALKSRNPRLGGGADNPDMA